MPELNALTRQKPTTVTVDLGEGDSITVVFNRNAITPAWMREAAKRDEAQDALSVAEALAGVILSWDVTNEGQAFLPTAENLAVLSFPAQSELLSRILENAVPGAAEGNVSKNTSSGQTPSSSSEPENLQNGQQPSPSLQPSAAESKT